MKHVARLTLKLDDFSFLHTRTRVLGRHVINNNSVGVTRRYITRATAQRIMKMLPDDIAKFCLGVSYSNITALPPHVHTREKCVINFYTEVAGQETVIYDGEVVRLDGETDDNGNGYFLVDKKPLCAVESFKAEIGDVWVLNTKQPHAVLSGTKKCSRWLIQVFLSMPFDETIKCMSSAGLYEADYAL